MPNSASHKKTYSITSKQAAFIEAQTEAGNYASASEVVRAGLNALAKEQQAREEWWHQEVRRTYEGVRDGSVKTRPAEDVLADAKEKLLAKAAAAETRHAG